ncbi:MAG: 16S rRNA (cytosine(1402)-N(4))-methyltransferase RsmH [Desulfobacteraceae bacterium]|jgi:16S rRNA (cytosine1402-N4)-methyltransferase
MPYNHTTAMLQESIDLLQLMPGMTVVDCTLGGCGHARAICSKIMPDGMLIGIDQDQDAINNAQTLLGTLYENIHIFHANFIRLPDLLGQLGLAGVDAIIVDLGISQNQIERSGRGFSFKRNEPLDMRMDTRTDLTAAQIINTWGQIELEKIFREYGEERWSKSIARRIVATRKKKKFANSLELAQLIIDTIPGKKYSRQNIHPATRVFMALRIAVNQELKRLENFLPTAVNLLNQKGRLCVLSFHSLEDRIVKHQFKALATTCTCPPKMPKCICGKKPQVKILTPKVKRPGKEEIKVNPMARSTRLRALEKY